MKRKFWLSNHCKQRYIERVNNGLHIDQNTLFSMLKTIELGIDITDKVYNEIPRYILYLYEKYKTAGSRIIKTKDNIIFIVSKRKGTDNLYDVLTCYRGMQHLEQYKTSILNRGDIFIKINLIKKSLKK